MPRLENWSVGQAGPLDAVFGVIRLKGVSVGDERIDPNTGNRMEGQVITTSPLKEFNIEKRQAQTLHTLYELGAVEAGYAEHIKVSDPERYAELVQLGYITDNSPAN